MATEEISKHIKKDAVVVCGGTWDIAKNATKKGPERTVKFVKENNHTNVVVMKAPNRYDLAVSSCVSN
jgi:hypothetical protein